MGYLDEKGLSHFWGKVREYADSQADRLTAWETYSLEEAAVGTWHDGRTVYQRSFEITSPSKANTLTAVKTNAFGVTNSAYAIEIQAIMHDTNTSDIVIPTYVNATSNGGIWYKADVDSIWMSVGSTYLDKPCTVTIKYVRRDDSTTSDPSESGAYLAPLVHEYDTDGGWHVRKWSNGYVEMTYTGSSILPKETALTAWGGVYSTSGDFIPEKTYPVALVKQYSEEIGFLGQAPANFSFWFYNLQDKSSNPLTHTRRHGLARGNDLPAPRGYDITFNYAIHVTGRWK